MLHSKHFKYFKAVKGAIALLRHPDNLEATFDIVAGLDDTQAFQRMMAYIMSNPDNAAMVRERYLGKLPDLDALMKLPEGSLGREFAARMKASNLDVVFYPKLDVSSDSAYVQMRVRMTHDIWHTITGFNINPEGELGLQAFMLAQLFTPLALVLMSMALLRSLGTRPPSNVKTTMHGLLDQITTGWQMGRTAAPLFAQKWEEGWARPLADWQRDLRITPVQYS